MVCFALLSSLSATLAHARRVPAVRQHDFLGGPKRAVRGPRVENVYRSAEDVEVSRESVCVFTKVISRPERRSTSKNVRFRDGVGVHDIEKSGTSYL